MSSYHQPKKKSCKIKKVKDKSKFLSYIYRFHQRLFKIYGIVLSCMLLLVFSGLKWLNYSKINLCICVSMLVFGQIWIRLEIGIHVSPILFFQYRPSTWFRYQWIGNCLNDEPQIGTPICQRLIYTRIWGQSVIYARPMPALCDLMDFIVTIYIHNISKLHFQKLWHNKSLNMILIQSPRSLCQTLLKYMQT